MLAPARVRALAGLEERELPALERGEVRERGVPDQQVVGSCSGTTSDFQCRVPAGA